MRAAFGDGAPGFKFQFHARGKRRETTTRATRALAAATLAATVTTATMSRASARGAEASTSAKRREGTREEARARAASGTTATTTRDATRGRTRSARDASEDARTTAVWVTTTAGALAGATARVCVAPLDVIKIRLQVQVERGASGKYRGLADATRTILREEGARAMWAGTVPALLLWVPYTAIQFTVLNKFKEAARERERAKPGSTAGLPVSFIGGAAAGSVATVATYPFDVIRTLLASQGHPKVYNNVFDAALGVVRERGVAKGLYAGVSVTLAEIVPASAVQFGSYAALKSNLPEVFGENDFACGFAAGTIARLVIHPLDVVKKRFQVAGFSRSLAYGQRVDAGAYKSFFAAVRTIARSEGVSGFYKGLTPSLIKSAPASAITFSVFEAARRLLERAADDDDEAPRR